MDFFFQSHLALNTDVSSMSSVAEAAESVKVHFGRVADVVVNCAGITRDAYLLKMTEENFDKLVYLFLLVLILSYF